MPSARDPRLGIKRLRARLDSWSIASRASVGSILLAVLVAGTFILTLIAVSDLRRSVNVQSRSRNVTSATLDLDQVVNQLEASLRAFLVSGNSRFLGSWRQSQRHLGPALARLDQALAGQRAESERASALESQIHAYVQEYGQPLIGIYRISPRAARAPVATQEGLFRINGIRGSFNHLLAGENALAAAASASARNDSTMAVRAGIGALALATLLLVGFCVFVARGVTRPVRSVATAATGVAAGDLSTRLPENGPAEIRALQSAFNTMSRSLADGKRTMEAQNEQLRESERLKSQLVSIVSHELRNPLTSILGYTSLLLRRDFTPDETKHYLEIIHQQGTRLTSLIDHFLDSENVEAGRMAVAHDPFDLKPLLLSEAKLVSDKAENHTVVVDIGREALPVRGDRERLGQVFANLLENAVKYSPAGGRVEVSAEVVDGSVSVSVRDEGIGIPEQHQRQIFTRFFRADAQRSGIGGTGLGLAVSREIVEAHGGRIDFTSAPDAGSRFWFELPLDAEHDLANLAADLSPAGKRSGSSKRRVTGPRLRAQR